MKKVLLMLVLMSVSMFAQNPGTPILSEDVQEMNHGGWGTIINVGANTGDMMTLDVTCDHSDPNGRGLCLFEPPTVQTCNNFPMVPFQNSLESSVEEKLVTEHQKPSLTGCSGSPVVFNLTYNTQKHQIYTALSPSTGNQIIETQYWWIGTKVHYYLHFTNWEIIY